LLARLQHWLEQIRPESKYAVASFAARRQGLKLSAEHDMTIGLLLLVFAFVLFVIAAVGVATRFNLIAAGLACWVLSQVLGR
jgi:hypothetical protein